MKEIPKKIVVIGGVAGGATAAARARRIDENAEITLIERGEYISFANCGLPYFLSGAIKNRNDLLLTTPEKFSAEYRIRVLIKTEGLRIDRKAKTVITDNPEKPSISYDTLILSQGAGPILPVMPGVESPHVFTLRNLEDMDRIESFLREKNPRTGVIAGGGFIGIEMAEALQERGLKVTIIEKAERIMSVADPEFASMAHRTLVEHGIEIISGRGITEIGAEDRTVRLDDGSSHPADIVLFSVGVRPELTLAREAGLSIGKTGGILVNSLLQSSDPDIFAIGDMAEISHRVCGRKVRIPLAGPANRQGRIAGANAAGERELYRGSPGSAVVKIFDRTLAMTGLSESLARDLGLDAGSVTVHGKDHASYYPGARELSLKIVFNKTTGIVLGGHAFGSNADKRIDVLSAGMQGRFTVSDLAELDLTYAPPYSSANDLLNFAGFVAENRLSGRSPSMSAMEMENSPILNDAFIVDVRRKDEYAAGHLPEAVNIPVTELRERYVEIPRNRNIVVYCYVGRRGHLAVRILEGHGIHAVNVSGGFKSMRHTMKHTGQN